VVVGEHHAPRLLQERRRVGGDKVLALAEADDERRLEARGDELVGVVGVDDDERKVTFHLAERQARSLEEVAVVFALDQMCDGLGVGLGGERVPFRLEPGFELTVVLDDPVQDDRHTAVVAAGERMGVPFGDAAVGRPAGVTQACRRLRAAVRRRGALQVPEVADRADIVQAVRLEQRDPGRIVAPVFEALQAVQKQRLNLLWSDISDDPAHAGPPCRCDSENAESPTRRTLGRADWLAELP
jgi:hypothetical protein